MRSAGFRFRPPVASASAAHLCPLTVMAVPLDLGLCVRVGGGGGIRKTLSLMRCEGNSQVDFILLIG